MQTRVHTTIDELDPGDWDGLAGDDVMAAHGWLRTVEATWRAAAAPRYVVLEDGGRLAAAAVAWVERPGDEVETLDHMVLGRLRRPAQGLGLGVLPALVCRSPHGFGTHLLLARDVTPERRSALLRLLLDRVEATAEAERLPTAVAHVLDGEHDLATELTRRGYLRGGHVPLNVLDLEWRSFDEYLAALDRVSRGARKDIRRQINRNRRRGVEIVRVEDPAPLEAELHRLLDQSERRHNRRPFPFRRGFLGDLVRNLGGEAVLYAAHKQGAVTGVSLMLVRGGVAQLPMVAVDHERAGDDFTYFNLAHYRPIADAIAAGVRRMVFGRALYDLKRRRGCRVTGLSVYVRPSSRSGRLALALWLPVLSRWTRRGLPPGLRWSGPEAGTASAATNDPVR